MKNFLIVLLMILIVGGTGYAIYYQVDKFNKESNVTNELIESIELTELGEKEELDVDDEQVKSLMAKVRFHITGCSEEQDPVVGYFYKKDKYNFTDIDDKVKLILAIENDEIRTKMNGSSKVNISDEKMKSLVKNIFGSKVKYKNQSFKRGKNCIKANYNKLLNNYKIKLLCHSKCMPSSRYSMKIISAIKYNDRIEITEKAIYLKEQKHSTKYNVYKPNKKDIIAKEIEMNGKFDSYFDKTDSYKYTFMLEDGNYYFNSVEKVEG